jgi:hypothetical protein
MLAPWLSVLTTVARSPEPAGGTVGFKFGGGIGVGGVVGFAAATGDGLPMGEGAGPASGDENALGGGSSVGEGSAVGSAGVAGAPRKPQAGPSIKQSAPIPISSLPLRRIGVNVTLTPT